MFGRWSVKNGAQFFQRQCAVTFVGLLNVRPNFGKAVNRLSKRGTMSGQL